MKPYQQLLLYQLLVLVNLSPPSEPTSVGILVDLIGVHRQNDPRTTATSKRRLNSCRAEAELGWRGRADRCRTINAQGAPLAGLWASRITSNLNVPRQGLGVTLF